MTQDEKNINKVFGDAFDAEPDPRIKTSSSGYTKIEDGETIKLRVTTNIYRYFTVQPEGEKLPLRNNDLRELLVNRTIDDLIEDQTVKVKERYAFVVWNHSTDSAEVWQVSRRVFENLRSLHRDEEWEGGLNKNDVKVTRSGSGTETTYSISYAPKSSELSEEQNNAILEVDVERQVAGAVRL